MGISALKLKKAPQKPRRVGVLKGDLVPSHWLMVLTLPPFIPPGRVDPKLSLLLAAEKPYPKKGYIFKTS